MEEAGLSERERQELGSLLKRNQGYTENSKVCSKCVHYKAPNCQLNPALELIVNSQGTCNHWTGQTPSDNDKKQQNPLVLNEPQIPAVDLTSGNDLTGRIDTDIEQLNS